MCIRDSALGEGLLDAGQPDRARPLLQEAARLAEAADRPRTEATASYHLAATLLALGEPGTALEHARRGLALLAGGSKPDLVWMLTIQAHALRALGRLEEALVSARRSLDLSDRHGPAAGEAGIRRLLAGLLAALGRREGGATPLAGRHPLGPGGAAAGGLPFGDRGRGAARARAADGRGASPVRRWGGGRLGGQPGLGQRPGRPAASLPLSRSVGRPWRVARSRACRHRAWACSWRPSSASTSPTNSAQYPSTR